MVTTLTAAPAETDGGDRKLLGAPARAVRKLTRSSRTTPGRLTIISITLAVLAVITGVTGALSVQQKQDTITDLAEHREPLAAAAQQIYRSLSDADATAASAFLSGGTEPEELRSRYEINVAQAGAALAKASSDIGGIPEAEQQVNRLAQQLPVYTGLVETARANNRQGFPAGAAYLREASGLMQNKILPAAEKLYVIDVDRLAAEQDDATDLPWIPLALTVLLLGGLIAAQVYLRRRTNRVFNIGLVIATVAVVVSLAWGAVAVLVESTRIDDSRGEGSQPVDLLVRARIDALKARTNETLTLVARGSGESYEQDFVRLSKSFSGDGNLLQRGKGMGGGAMTNQVDQATKNADAWLAVHRKIRELDVKGGYDDAVKLAVGQAPDGAAVVFGRLDANLNTAITEGRKSFSEATSQGSNALTLLAPGLAVLALVAAAGITLGIRERLREYR
ncbi:hypothetical protein EV193_101711 [Herbihabitans rhizosphaerae]|uniref:Secreted protein n=1 Tax=Herbihabitans rhizosphaerae TaxID=1872711 RepID=A0A4Q7L852_9PSEU|nr:hypothetical protein [Herbihabitans rhizosphaerae]RZS44831.1 hypothetical protein EV193_101711 [Herbihabitans rhizosphaerae]